MSSGPPPPSPPSRGEVARARAGPGSPAGAAGGPGPGPAAAGLGGPEAGGGRLRARRGLPGPSTAGSCAPAPGQGPPPPPPPPSPSRGRLPSRGRREARLSRAGRRRSPAGARAARESRGTPAGRGAWRGWTPRAEAGLPARRRTRRPRAPARDQLLAGDGPARAWAPARRCCRAAQGRLVTAPARTRFVAAPACPGSADGRSSLASAPAPAPRSVVQLQPPGLYFSPSPTVGPATQHVAPVPRSENPALRLLFELLNPATEPGLSAPNQPPGLFSGSGTESPLGGLETLPGRPWPRCDGEGRGSRSPGPQAGSAWDLGGTSRGEEPGPGAAPARPGKAPLHLVPLYCLEAVSHALFTRVKSR
ncbi:uncharacterized protein J5F26_007716 [Ciconia maguari]